MFEYAGIDLVIVGMILCFFFSFHTCCARVVLSLYFSALNVDLCVAILFLISPSVRPMCTRCGSFGAVIVHL